MPTFLFHQGQNVRIKHHHCVVLNGMEGRVEAIVLRGERIHCPHCDKIKKPNSFEVMYYLSIAHPLNCCLPFSSKHLQHCDAISEFITYDNLMTNLKEYS